jgi:hypothetical protein
MMNNSMLGGLLGVVLAAGLQLLISAKAEEISASGPSSITQETPRDNKRQLPKSLARTRIGYSMSTGTSSSMQ